MVRFQQRYPRSDWSSTPRLLEQPTMHIKSMKERTTMAWFHCVINKYSQKIIIFVSLALLSSRALVGYFYNAWVLCSYYEFLCIFVLCLELIQIFIMRTISASIIYFMKSKVTLQLTFIYEYKILQMGYSWINLYII